jgi:excinuclease ABC subunit A
MRQGAIFTVGPFKGMGRWRRHEYEGLANTLGFSLDTPWEKLAPEFRSAVLDGTGQRHITFRWRGQLHGGHWAGVVPPLLEKYKKSTSPMHRAMYEKYMRILPCGGCEGARLNPQARSVRVGGKTLVEIGAMDVASLARFFDDELLPALSPVETYIAGDLIRETRTRIGFLLDVGLEYLSLERTAPTLSGGELQRIRLAGQIGSGLVGVLYVLDEPSIGLHPRDNQKLIATLCRLRDQGNTVIVVEHDEDTIRAADLVVDFGPGPGVRGGEIVACGDLRDVEKNERSITGQYLSGERRIEIPKRRPVSGEGPAAVNSKKVAAESVGGRRKPETRVAKTPAPKEDPGGRGIPAKRAGRSSAVKPSAKKATRKKTVKPKRPRRDA